MLLLNRMTFGLKSFMSLMIVLSFCMAVGTAQPQRGKCSCGSMIGYHTRLKTDQMFAKNEQRLENEITKYIQRYRKIEETEFRSGVVVIPVVVHVVYNNARENISDAQIQSQIDALNRDFRRSNADIANVPDEFRPFIADTRIEFQLAERDPYCYPTSGITRTKTKVEDFVSDLNAPTPPERNPVKFNSSGGKDGWPSDQYLNIWVCDLSEAILGYASFPSDLEIRPEEDGVVIDYEYFGTLETATAPYNLGRTTAHEIGHWLNLRHIWGDERPGEDPCSGSDFVEDTPDQANPNYMCPTHPQFSCGSNDMFMNYMDYVYDNCMVMFSQGQADRMNAVLYTTRASIVSSQGDIPPSAVASGDLFLRDSDKDQGAEPNMVSTHLFNSDEIWVRHTKDGFTNQEHQNPYGNAINYIYVRVRNRGCHSSGQARLKLYWAKASSGVSWPKPWDGSVLTPAPLGGLIGVKSIHAVPGSEFQIIEYKWKVPNPNDYISSAANKVHFSLLARIETSSTFPYGMTTPETSDLFQNVKNNNNIVLKNVSISEPHGEEITGSFLISNYDRKKRYFRIAFEDSESGMSIFDYGDLTVSLEHKLYKIWRGGGKSGNGINAKRRKEGIRILQNGAYLGNIQLGKSESAVINISFKPNHKKLKFDRNIFKLDVKQYRTSKRSSTIIGEKTFVFRVSK